MEQSKFDVLICVASKDNLIIRSTIKQIVKNINPRNIYIITKPQYRLFYCGLINKSRLIILDEDKVVPSLSYSKLNNIIESRVGDKLRTGWYFQQFLKMGFVFSKYANNKYLIWDADTLPVKKIPFFNKNHPYFTMKTEYHKPYFDTMSKLLNLTKLDPGSFIAEHMIIDVSIMKELISKIGDLNSTNLWYEKIINNIDSNEKYGFSEFETYGTYTTLNYPEYYIKRTLCTCREGGYEYGRVIFKSDIRKMEQSEYDIISLEPAHKPKFYRKHFQFIVKIALYSVNILLDNAIRIKYFFAK